MNRNVLGRLARSTATILTDTRCLSSCKLFFTLNCKSSFLWRPNLLQNFYEITLHQTVIDRGSINVKQLADYILDTRQKSVSYH
jgi:hypothetical protein